MPNLTPDQIIRILTRQNGAESRDIRTRVLATVEPSELSEPSVWVEQVAEYLRWSGYQPRKKSNRDCHNEGKK